MTRPADDKCAACGRELPDEPLRDDLSRGTDVCAQCAMRKVSALSLTPAYGRWLSGWKDKLLGLIRGNLR